MCVYGLCLPPQNVRSSSGHQPCAPSLFVVRDTAFTCMVLQRRSFLFCHVVIARGAFPFHSLTSGRTLVVQPPPLSVFFFSLSSSSSSLSFSFPLLASNHLTIIACLQSWQIIRCQRPRPNKPWRLQMESRRQSGSGSAQSCQSSLRTSWAGATEIRADHLPTLKTASGRTLSVCASRSDRRCGHWREGSRSWRRPSGLRRSQRPSNPRKREAIRHNKGGRITIRVRRVMGRAGASEEVLPAPQRPLGTFPGLALGQP